MTAITNNYKSQPCIISCSIERIFNPFCQNYVRLVVDENYKERMKLFAIPSNSYRSEQSYSIDKSKNYDNKIKTYPIPYIVEANSGWNITTTDPKNAKMFHSVKKAKAFIIKTFKNQLNYENPKQIIQTNNTIEFIYEKGQNAIKRIFTVHIIERIGRYKKLSTTPTYISEQYPTELIIL